MNFKTSSMKDIIDAVYVASDESGVQGLIENTLRKCRLRGLPNCVVEVKVDDYTVLSFTLEELVGDAEGEGEHSSRTYCIESAGRRRYVYFTGFYTSECGTEWDDEYQEVFPGVNVSLAFFGNKEAAAKSVSDAGSNVQTIKAAYEC
jgi:hypothetical protein